jgi:hypothetical protein
MHVSFVLPVEFIAEPGGGDEVMSSYSRSHESRSTRRHRRTRRLLSCQVHVTPIHSTFSLLHRFDLVTWLQMLSTRVLKPEMHYFANGPESHAKNGVRRQNRIQQVPCGYMYLWTCTTEVLYHDQSPDNSIPFPSASRASTSSIVHALGTCPGGIFVFSNVVPPARLAAAFA